MRSRCARWLETGEVPQDRGAEQAPGPAPTSGAVRPALERRVRSVPIVPALALVAALWAGQMVLVPIVLSILISYALEPLVVVLGRRVPRTWAVPLVMMLLAGAVGAGGFVLRGEAIAFVNRLPVAAHTVAEAIRQGTRAAPATLSRVRVAAGELESAANGATSKRVHDGVTPVRIEEPTFKWSDWLWQGSYGVAEFGGQMFAVLCLVYYLLAAGDLYKRKLVHLVPTLSDKKITVEIFAEIDRQIERFLLARVAISAVVGIAIWIAFHLIGVEEAGVWGVLSALLFAIPIVGPTLIVIAAAVAAFMQFGSVGMTGVVAVLCVVIAALEGYLLTPWLMSRVGEMNAVAVFVSLLFWGWIWGAWGLLLAVPITAVAKAICERIPDLVPFAELLKE